MLGISPDLESQRQPLGRWHRVIFRDEWRAELCDLGYLDVLAIELLRVRESIEERLIVGTGGGHGRHLSVRVLRQGGRRGYVWSLLAKQRGRNDVPPPLSVL